MTFPLTWADLTIGVAGVVAVLERLAHARGLPKAITLDNGPEFTGKTLHDWARARGIKLNFTAPRKPTQNAYIESFNGKFRNECLNQHWFTTLHEARLLIEAWRTNTTSSDLMAVSKESRQINLPSNTKTSNLNP